MLRNLDMPLIFLLLGISSLLGQNFIKNSINFMVPCKGWNYLVCSTSVLLTKDKYFVMEQPDYGSFTEYFELEGHSIYFAVHPEMNPYKNSILATGQYFVYCIDPIHGSCHFIIEQDEKYKWTSEHLPSFINPDLVGWIGERIEFKSKQDLV